MRLALAAALALLASAPATAAAVPCAPWPMTTLASGLGSLENVEPDGTGGLLLSATDRRAIVRLAPDGTARTVVADVEAPGGLRVRGTTLFFTTGDSARAGALSETTGTLERVDLATGVRSPYATGLTMPNGLAFLPNGDALTSRDIGGGTGITRVPVEAPSRLQTRWFDQADTNGIELDPTGRFLYVVETFTVEGALRRVRVSDRRAELIANVAGANGPKGLDDLDVDGNGLVYIAANGTGEVIRVDPADGSSCVIASGLRSTSAVKFGRGPGRAADHLFVVGFDGVVRELTPPAGLVVRPPVEPPLVGPGAPVAAPPAAAPPTVRARSCRPRVPVPRRARALRPGAVVIAGAVRRRLALRPPRSLRIRVARGSTVRPRLVGRDRFGRRVVVPLRTLRCPAS